MEWELLITIAKLWRNLAQKKMRPVVDDEPKLVRLVRAVLSAAGFEIIFMEMLKAPISKNHDYSCGFHIFGCFFHRIFTRSGVHYDYIGNKVHNVSIKLLHVLHRSPGVGHGY